MGRKLDLSLTSEELEAYLASQPTARVATATHDGVPHVVPLWFVWSEGVLYLNSTVGNVTVENGLKSGSAAAVVDDGERYDELRGVMLRGSFARADDDPHLERVERLWSDKYLGGSPAPYRLWRDRLWLRLIPEHVASWDFRKIPEAREKRDAERRAREA
jgi:nitroimidazol reductase NimA-like FMN-containing flavoprotein (pyridoxamine 5'-phosphate oxidase superfamily)